MRINIRRHPQRAVTYGGQHVSQDTPVACRCHHHIRALARCLLDYLKQLPAVEEVAVVQLGQVFLFADNMCDGRIHGAKIEKYYELWRINYVFFVTLLHFSRFCVSLQRLINKKDI